MFFFGHPASYHSIHATISWPPGVSALNVSAWGETPSGQKKIVILSALYINKKIYILKYQLYTNELN